MEIDFYVENRVDCKHLNSRNIEDRLGEERAQQP